MADKFVLLLILVYMNTEKYIIDLLCVPEIDIVKQINELADKSRG